MISLILSGVLMFVVLSVISAVDVRKLVRQDYYGDSDMYLKLNSTADETSTYELMKNSPFTESLRSEITKIPGVTSIYPSKMLDCKVYNSDTPKSEGMQFPWVFLVCYAGFIFAVHTIVTSYQKHLLLKSSVAGRIRAID